MENNVNLNKLSFTPTLRELLSIPFIWWMFIPVIILDFFMTIYSYTALKLYRIPSPKRSDFILYDREQLSYLKYIQKLHCLYCSYVNWVLQYSVDIAWRTEKYWCPIKHAKRKKWWHSWEKLFAEYWDYEWYKETFCRVSEFKNKK